MPPSYEQAMGAVKFLESVEATKAAAAAATAEEQDNTDFEREAWECEKAMRIIIGKYIEHQHL